MVFNKFTNISSTNKKNNFTQKLKKDQEKKLLDKLHNILILMKELFEFINGTDQALTYEMLDDKNKGFDKRILLFNARVIAFLEKIEWPTLFVLVASLSFYLLINL